MSGLRFAMVTTFYPPFNFGGDGIAIQRLARALARHGHHVSILHDVDAYRVVSGGSPPAETPESADNDAAPAGGDSAPVDDDSMPSGDNSISSDTGASAVDEKLQIHRLKSGLGSLSPLLTHQFGRPVANGRRIRRILSQGRFDVIHFHNVSLVGGPGIWSAGEGVKLHEAHEHWLVCPTHVLWRHKREVCTGRQCLRCVLRNGRPPQLWRGTGYMTSQLSHVDTFIAKSEFSRRKHREFGFPREMRVLPYFLPDDVPAQATPEEVSPHVRPYFLFIGRLERIKGLDDVLPLFEEYDDADLLIAGDGEHDDQLRMLAGTNPRVRFLGRVAPEALRRYLDHAIALIVPSVCFETFGIVLIEAFRQGTPVIARRIGPLPEIVERCGGGVLFGDPAELPAVMARLQREPDARAAMARRARDGFTRHWSEAAVLPRYLALVREAAESRGLREIIHKLNGERVA